MDERSSKFELNGELEVRFANAMTVFYHSLFTENLHYFIPDGRAFATNKIPVSPRGYLQCPRLPGEESQER